MKYVISLLGYLFVAIVAVSSAIVTESNLFRILLIISALVSLSLALWGIVDKKKTKAEIDKLKSNQLSISVEGSTLTIHKGNIH